MDRARLLTLFDRLIASHEGITRKGKSMPYTAVNGNMFTFVDPDDRLCLRLSKTDRADWAETFPADPVLQYGKVMRGYVAVPPELLNDEPTLHVWFARAVTSARALPAKPTTRKKQN